MGADLHRGVGGGRPSSGGGGEEDGIGMKGAQSKVKWGAMGDPWCEWGVMPPQTPHSYTTASYAVDYDLSVNKVLFCV